MVAGSLPLLSIKNKQIKNLLLRLREVEKSVPCAYEVLTNTSVETIKNIHIQKMELFFLYQRTKAEKNETDEKCIDKSFKFKIFNFESFIPIYMPYAEERKNVDKSSALHSFDGPLQLMHANIADIRFFACSAVDPKYSMLVNELYTSENYAYTTKNKSFSRKKWILSINIYRIKEI